MIAAGSACSSSSCDLASIGHGVYGIGLESFLDFCGERRHAGRQAGRARFGVAGLLLLLGVSVFHRFLIPRALDMVGMELD